MKGQAIKIRSNYYLECPDCGGEMFLENNFEALVTNPRVGHLWKCKKCSKEYHLKMVEYKPKSTNGESK